MGLKCAKHMKWDLQIRQASGAETETEFASGVPVKSITLISCFQTILYHFMQIFLLVFILFSSKQFSSKNLNEQQSWEFSDDVITKFSPPPAMDMGKIRKESLAVNVGLLLRRGP